MRRTSDLQLAEIVVESPMGEAPGYVLTDKIGLIPVLRAGLGMVDGIWGDDAGGRSVAYRPLPR